MKKIILAGIFCILSTFLLISLLFSFSMMFFSYCDIIVIESDQFSPSFSEVIVPQNWGLKAYFKEGKDFTYVFHYGLNDNIKLTAKLPIKNIINIEQELDKRKVDNFEITCKDKKYARLCTIMEANKDSKIKVYKIKNSIESERNYIEPRWITGPIYWFLYKNSKRIGISDQSWWENNIYECASILCHIGAFFFRVDRPDPNQHTSIKNPFYCLFHLICPSGGAYKN